MLLAPGANIFDLRLRQEAIHFVSPNPEHSVKKTGNIFLFLATSQFKSLKVTCKENNIFPHQMWIYNADHHPIS